MKQIIAASVLGVWLIFELKDFFYNGGFSNTLAFGILRICIVIVMLSLLLTANLVLGVLPNIFKTLIMNEKDQIDQRIMEITRLAQASNKNNISTSPSPTQPGTPPRNRTPIKQPLDFNTVRKAFKNSRRTL
jgi:hypothetical protein